MTTATFPPATRDDWMALVEGALKGAPYAERLVTRTVDGIALDALPEAPAALPPPDTRPGGRPWTIAARIDHPDPTTANAQALEELEGGSSGLALVFAGAPAGHGGGLVADDLRRLERTLADVRLDAVALRLEAGGGARAVAALAVALVERRGLDPKDVCLAFGFDPLGSLAAMGCLSAGEDEVARRLAETITGLRRRGFSGRFVELDGRPYHAAGASEAEEIAAVVATGIWTLRRLEAAGIDPESAVDVFGATLATDTDMILGIAKIRALRRLWRRVEEATGLAPRHLRLHAETSWRMLTRRDVHTNLIRSTLAGFAAGVGGADSVTLLPFTLAGGLPDAAARRLARNAQTILVEEANLHRVADPAAGAGAIEAATEALAARAWTIVQAIEREGGMLAALTSGSLARRIAASAAERAARIAAGAQKIIGVTAFPPASEAEVPPAEATPPAPSPGRGRAVEGTQGQAPDFDALVAAAAEGASLAELTARVPAAGAVRIPPLVPRRVAEAFEA